MRILGVVARLLVVFKTLVLAEALEQNEEMLEPEALKSPPSRLALCSEMPQNVFFLLDVSGSIQGKAMLRKFRNQRRYTEKVLDAFGEAGSASVRFGISAYSRFAAHVRSLKNPRSGDVEYMKKSIKSFKHFKQNRWDSPNGFKTLTKKGNRFTHMGNALRTRVDNVLASVSGDSDFGVNNTVILFTDGRPENYLYRNRQGGKQKFTNKQEFWKSLKPVVEQRNRERAMYDPALFRVHCAMLVTGTYYSNKFVNDVCDSYESVHLDLTAYSDEGPIEVDDCGTLSLAGSPSTAPTLSPSTAPSATTMSSPTISPSLSPTISPSGASSTSPTPSLTNAPSISPSTAPTPSPSASPSSSPVIFGPPSLSPIVSPTNLPSESPTTAPSGSPTSSPTSAPSSAPSLSPSSSPSATPTNTPTFSPTSSPSLTPTGTPTATPTLSPTASPTNSPSLSPSSSPTVFVIGVPTTSPTTLPSLSPSSSPTGSPTGVPTISPTPSPTASPSISPSVSPSSSPTGSPTGVPTVSPTLSPTASPSISPSVSPSSSPTGSPTGVPTISPTSSPTASPSISPSVSPSSSPTGSPTGVPTVSPTLSPTASPSISPSVSPSSSPTGSPTGVPTISPTSGPTASPSISPSVSPSSSPTGSPTGVPTISPTSSPTASPSISPSVSPSLSPTLSPTGVPTTSPTSSPTASPTDSPSVSPSLSPTASPSISPSVSPSLSPTVSPTAVPTTSPTASPTASPTISPSVSPSLSPTKSPTGAPTTTPTFSPTASPTTSPSVSPSSSPTTSPTAPTVSPTSSPSRSPTISPTLAPTISPTASPTIYASCSVTPVFTFEDVGRIPDPGNESLILPVSGPEFEISCVVDPSLLNDFVSFDFATTTMGDFYFEGEIVNSIPGSRFVSDGLGGFTLSGLSFMPAADRGGRVDVTHTMHTTRSDTLLPYTNEFDQTLRVCGIADIPEVTNIDACVTTNEDEVAQVPFVTVLHDLDRSERLTAWRTVLLSPIDNFKTLNNIRPTTTTDDYGLRCGFADRCANVNYPVLAAEDYSGMLELTVQGRAQELFITCSEDERFAYSNPPQPVAIRVLPVADLPELVPFSNTRLLEDTRLLLAPRINFAPSRDQDGSEEHFLIIEESSVPTGASLFVNDVRLDASSGIFEVPMSDVVGLSLQPPLDSNEDFALVLRSRTVDTIVLPNCSGTLETVSDTATSGDVLFPIQLKGVADPPTFFNDSSTNWTVSTSGAVPVVSILYEEDAPLMLDMGILDGESSNTEMSSGDGSEMISVIVSIPPSIMLSDISFVSYIGTNSAGEAEYEVAAEDMKLLRLILPEHQTTDVKLDARVVATENDGNSFVQPFEIEMKISPVIDAGNYVREITSEECAMLAEDIPASVDILPPVFEDSQESIVAIQFSGLPAGYKASFDGSPLASDAGGAYTLTSAQVDRMVNSGIQLEILTSSNQDLNPQLLVTSTVEQEDADSDTISTKDIEGNILVRLRAVAEIDGLLQFQDGTGGVVDAVRATPSNVVTLGDPRLVFVSSDPSSVEDLGSLTLQFPAGLGNRFLVAGAVFDGTSRWVITNGDFQNVVISAIIAPAETFTVLAIAEIYDFGVPGENDTSCPLQMNTTLTMTFNTGGGPPCTSIAGDATLAPGIVRGIEDTVVDFGSQLTVSVASENAANDVVGIRIPASTLENFPAVDIFGGNFEFSTGDYIFSAPANADGIVDLSGLSLLPPEHYAGDFELNMIISTFDVACGVVATSEVSVIIELEPKVELPVVTALVAEGTPAEDQMINLEVYIESLVDRQPKTLGEELLSEFDVRIDPMFGTILPIVTNETSGVARIQVIPAPDFSGEATLEISALIEDTALFDLSGSVERKDSVLFTETARIYVEPECDTPVFTIPSDLATTEFGQLPLTSIEVTPGDVDGSESLISVVVDNVPEEFLFRSPAQNIGFNKWLIVPVAGELTGFGLLLPEFFSGTVTFELTANIKEDLLDITETCSTTEEFSITVLPVPNELISSVQTVYRGAEDDDITLNLDLAVQDDSMVYGSMPNVVESPPETISVIFSDVPPAATISVDPSARIVQIDETTWQVDTDETSLDSVVFNPGKFNGVAEIKMVAKSIDNGVVLPDDLSLSRTLTLTISGTNDAPVITAAPVTFVPSNTILTGISIFDPDSYDQPFTVELGSTSGSFQIVDASLLSTLSATIVPTGITIEGSMANINRALNGEIRFVSSVAESITIEATDSSGSTSTGSISVL